MNSDKSIEELLFEAIELANQKFDGHFTIGKFTTCWQVMGDTPSDFIEWQIPPKFRSLKDALEHFINTQCSVRDTPKEVLFKRFVAE